MDRLTHTQYTYITIKLHIEDDYFIILLNINLCILL